MSIDTPEFRELLEEYFYLHHMKSFTDLIAHIDAKIAEAVNADKRWPIRGVRVDDDKVIIAVIGGDDAARWLCGELLAKKST